MIHFWGKKKESLEGHFFIPVLDYMELWKERNRGPFQDLEQLDQVIKYSFYSYFFGLS